MYGSFEHTLNQIHQVAKFTKFGGVFGAVGDRFIATFSGTFTSHSPDVNGTNFGQEIHGETQFDITESDVTLRANYNGVYAYEFSITFDDVFSGAQATMATVRQQFLSAMNTWFNDVSITASSGAVYPISGGGNTGGGTGGGGNTGGQNNYAPPVGNNLVLPTPPKPPGTHGSIYNSFFNEKGELTGVGIGVITVGSIALITLVVKNKG